MLQPFFSEGLWKVWLLQVIEVVAILLAGEAGTGLADALELAVALDVGMGIVHLE